MAVPANTAAYLVNTTGGAFSATVEGGTILGNTSTGTAITKALALKDNATDFPNPPFPTNTANGSVSNHKPYTAGTFGYSAAGKYVIAASSTTISGVSSTKVLITSASRIDAIHQFRNSFGAKTVTAFRAGRFSWTSTKRTGAAIAARINWLTVASGGMDTASAPAANNAAMWDPINDAVGYDIDSAANPTRAIPGELVMKVDFVTLNPVLSAGDFFDYAAITGM
tara:strand:+ start:5122 stop:5796 length:675 start_codon:yes stop_codon:yes gene_type:complete